MAKRIVHQVHTSLQLATLAGIPSNVEWVPNTDIYENESSFVICMELAGLGADQIDIKVSERILIVRGKRPDPCRLQQGCHFRQMEINHGFFERRLTIPLTVDTSGIKATHRNGFLMLELPKVTKPSYPPHPVMIQEGED